MKKERLYSLDLLRGIDIFFLTVCFLPILYFHRHWPAPEWVKYQFWHPSWEGFSVLDMLMPLFIFMAGAALPLALKKRLEATGVGLLALGFALVALFRKAFSNCGWDPFDGDGIVWSDARGLARFFSAETVTLLTIIGKSALICVAVWFLEEWNKRGRMAK